MKKLGFFGTVLFWVNSLAVFLLFLAFFLPYVAPSTSPTLSILSLGVSPLLWLNFLFLVYWLLRRKRVSLLSASALVIAYFIFNPFYKFSSEGDASTTQQTLSVLSYNVRLFNLYEAESKTKEASEVLSEIIKEKDPDIICLQEFIKKHSVDFSAYPFIYTEFKKDNTLGHAIYSKHPIINTGSFNFKETANNTIFADIVHGTDTIRVYNLHLHHGQRCQYPKIMAGDFNNTPFSYVYRYLSEDMQDAFLERGNGLGTTFNFDFYPMRIDYILTSENLNILSFERIDTTFSDHYPMLSKMVIE